MTTTHDGIATQPPLVGSPTTGGTKLPLPNEAWADLQEDLAHLSVHWANKLYGSDLDLDAASKDDVARWLLGHMTVVEALVTVVRDRQTQLARVAKNLHVPDERVGAACGITPEGARRRKHRGTK